MRDGIPFLSLHIPFSKTTGTAGATITITKLSTVSNIKSCPYTALQFHLCMNSVNIPGSAPLFSFRHGTSFMALMKQLFLDCCNAVWQVAGMSLIPGGHSFCIRGTTELLLRGVSPDIVAMQGRWRSDAFLLYWRKIEYILPLFISCTFTDSDST